MQRHRHPPTLGLQEFTHPRVGGFDLRNGAFPAGDGALIRDDDECESSAFKISAGGRGPGEELHEFGIKEGAGVGRVRGDGAIEDERVVAVEEDGGARRQRMIGAGNGHERSEGMRTAREGHKGRGLSSAPRPESCERVRRDTRT